MEDVMLTGAVEDIIFQNNDNGYAVFNVMSKGEEVVCVGVVPQLHEGETLKITGNWVVHPMYGKQLQVNFFEKSIPTTASGMEKYLSSGVIKGIGPKIAKKIVDKFGDASFYVIEEKPDRLSEIKGITYQKAMTINAVFQEQHELRRAMLFLQDFGVSPTYAMKIYKKYKNRTYEIVKDNPYRLADEVFGIGFKMADKMAAVAGMSLDSPKRIASGVKYTLNQASQSGHIYLPKAELEEAASKLLGVNPAFIDNSIRDLQVEGQVWQDNIDGVDCVYLNSLYYAEISVAKKLLELAEDFEPQNAEQLEEIITKAEGSSGIALADKQKQAVREAMKSGLLIITGGPGTGKTTAINTILQILSMEEQDIILAAPTGRAAKRMTEATGINAQTIHRLLGINFVGENTRQQTFDKNENDPLEADIIIIDETSMVDILLMHALVRAIAPGTRLILVGDVDQLPSVGPGNVLKDIIKSQRLNVVRLDQIFRQAQESAIIMNAHRINKGERPVLNEKEKDFFFMKRANTSDVVSTIVELVNKRLPNFLKCDSFADIQILTPMRKSPVGVHNLNAVLQQALNPPAEDKPEKDTRTTIFRLGDKVMQIKNNYNIVWKMYNEMDKRIDEGVGIFNGDQGVITDIDTNNETMQVTYEGSKRVDYDFTQLDELELAYAITIHKSQGSEYQAVVLPIHSGPPMLMSRNLLYTAVTRAKQLVVIVGLPETVYAMIDNNREINRYSSLATRIQNLYDFMNEG